MEADRIDAATLATATGTASPLMQAEQWKSESQLRRNLKRFLVGNRLNLLGVIIVGFFLFLAVFGQAARAARSVRRRYHQFETAGALAHASLRHR